MERVATFWYLPSWCYYWGGKQTRVIAAIGVMPEKNGKYPLRIHGFGDIRPACDTVSVTGTEEADRVIGLRFNCKVVAPGVSWPYWLETLYLNLFCRPK